MNETSIGMRRQAEMILLKQRLVLQRLNDTAEPERHYRIICEAEATADLAAGTGFPLLIFPTLFEERLIALEQRPRPSLRLNQPEPRPSSPGPRRPFRLGLGGTRLLGPGAYLMLLRERRQETAALLQNLLPGRGAVTPA